MTAREMQIAFIRQIGTINPELEFPKALDSDTIFYFLSIAQDKYLKSTYLNNGSVKDNVNALKKGIDDIRKLVTRGTAYSYSLNSGYVGVSEPSNIIGTDSNSENTYKIHRRNDNSMTIALPTDYMYYLSSETKVQRSDTSSIRGWVNNLLIDLSEVNSSMFDSGYNIAINREPKAFFDGNTYFTGYESITLILDSFTEYYNFDITYIRRPNAISLTTNCELSISSHIEIVNLAVTSFIEDYKYKLASQLGGKQ